MLLGESHICGTCKCDECLISKNKRCIDGHCSLVREQILKGSISTYSRFEKQFTGAIIKDKKSRMLFWQQFLFTNFLSIAMPKSGKAPAKKFYTQDCRNRFVNLVKKYQPSYIIIWGNRTWNNLPGDIKSGMWKKELISKYKGFEIWELMIERTNSVRVLKIHHPAYRKMTSELFMLWKLRIDYLLQQ